MSPELETLDQLLGGEIPLSTVRQIYPDQSGFERGVLGLLAGGDVRLLSGTGEIPQRQWRDAIRTLTNLYTLSVTQQGMERVS